jgi:phage antirepressor YoqD-like protein
MLKISANLSVFFLLNISINCNTIKGQNLKAVEIYYKLQMPQQNGKLFDLVDSVKLIYYKTFILFQIPYTEEHSKVYWDSTGEPHEQLIRNELKHTYFIYEKADSIGFEYKSLNGKFFQTKNVDTFLNTKVFGNIVFYDRENDILIKTEKLNSNVLLEKHTPKVKFDNSYSDSLYFYFSDKFKLLNYSLSKELDSIKQKKLFKVVLIYNSGYDTVYRLQMPRREYIFEIRSTTINNSKNITDFFERFDAWYKQNRK